MKTTFVSSLLFTCLVGISGAQNSLLGFNFNDSSDNSTFLPASNVSSCISGYSWSLNSDGLGYSIVKPGVSDPRVISNDGTRSRCFGGWDIGDSYNAGRTSFNPTNQAEADASYTYFQSGTWSYSGEEMNGENDAISFSMQLGSDVTSGYFDTITFDAMLGIHPNADPNVDDGANGPDKLDVYAYYLDPLTNAINYWKAPTTTITNFYSPSGGTGQYDSYSVDLSGLNSAIAANGGTLADRRIYFDLYAWHSDTSLDPADRDLLDLDNISFNGTLNCAPVPEPASAILLGFASLGFLARRKRS